MGTKFVNLMTSPVRVMRNSDISDGSYISFRSCAAEYGTNLEDTSIEAYNIVELDNVFVLDTKCAASVLPEPEENTVFIVPMEVAIGSSRADLVYPFDGMTKEGSNSVVYRGLARFNHNA